MCDRSLLLCTNATTKPLVSGLTQELQGGYCYSKERLSISSKVIFARKDDKVDWSLLFYLTQVASHNLTLAGQELILYMWFYKRVLVW